MGGIDPAIITHRLNVNPSFKPFKKKRRSFAPERQKAINEKVGKLLQAGAIREVEYPEWLVNVVLIKKVNGKWRLYIDFTGVNRACPKDSFPLPQIDLIVDATTSHELLSFMDAFSDYNQISMDPDDQEKTSFVTGQGTYFYRVMPFGLKNAGYLPEVGEQDVLEANRGIHGGVYRRHVGEINHGRASHSSYVRSIPDPERVQHEVESSQMRLWSRSQKILRSCLVSGTEGD